MKIFISVFALFASLLSLQTPAQETFVIVHGAWGGGWSFKEADSTLSAHGHLVYRPTLTGQGERVHLASPDIDLRTHVLDVVNTILYEDLRDIILVGHSYGGMVITGVADSVPERIKKLVYLDAFVPENGESLLTARPRGQAGPEGNADEDFVVPKWVQPGTLPPHDVPQSSKTFSQPVQWKNSAALALPAVYILTIDEGKQPEEDFFSYFANRAENRDWQVVHLTAGHNPQWNQVPELCSLLEAAAED